MPYPFVRRNNRPESLLQDPLLAENYRPALQARQEFCFQQRKRLLGSKSLLEFADWQEYFALQKGEGGRWCIREWLPNATDVMLIGEFSSWQENQDYALYPIGDGIWEGVFSENSLSHGQQYRLKVRWPGGEGWRLPSSAVRTIRQAGPNGETVFNAQVWAPKPYCWRHPVLFPVAAPLIYEAHIGMAQQEGKVGTFQEFSEKVLPRIAQTGYNCVQLMAIAQHPYYASFGYQVSNYFAVCDLYGTPEEFKALIDQAHGLGLRVIMDLVHSHSVRNVLEGLSELCGCRSQFFHAGERGEHPAWGSYCFDYGKEMVCRFLLSNCRYWLEEFNLDGFRFDGVTSMLYRDHGLQRIFASYDEYFGENVELEAFSYLALANELIQVCRPGAWSIAEEVSGMPGLAASLQEGGCGFGYRMAMGVTDYWFILLDKPDGTWLMSALWHELCNRRKEEQTISYVECHDQSLVGGQSFLFRCLGERIYDSMHVDCHNSCVDRGIALHKMSRLATLASAGHGYLTFMGNEFGHPEWIDFPRPGNNWSFEHARRRWDLCEEPKLKFHFLLNFEKEMLGLVNRTADFFLCKPQLLVCNDAEQILVFERAGLIFIFNFNPQKSFPNYSFSLLPGTYSLQLDSDQDGFGGWQRIKALQRFFTKPEISNGGLENRISVYLPARTVIVLQKE
ncbi:MAG: alpha amylase C-terminal domain-containing protein [Lentisphaeria bacterium]